MTENKKLIYFAHPFDKWRTPREEFIEKVLEERGYTVINPFKQENKLNKKYGVDNYYHSPCIEFAKDIVDKDYDMVNNCDEIFCWIPKGITMIGTIIELMWANYLNKKITVLCYKPQPFFYRYAEKLYISYDDFKKDIPYVWKSCFDFRNTKIEFET